MARNTEPKQKATQSEPAKVSALTRSQSADGKKSLNHAAIRPVISFKFSVVSRSKVPFLFVKETPVAGAVESGVNRRPFRRAGQKSTTRLLCNCGQCDFFARHQSHLSSSVAVSWLSVVLMSRRSNCERFTAAGRSEIPLKFRTNGGCW